MKIIRSLVVVFLLVLVGTLARADRAGRNARKADTRGVLPQLTPPPSVDGVVEHQEWADALVYNGVLYQMTLNLFPRNVEWRLGWTPEGLYIAAHTVRLKGETPRAETTDGTIDSLAKDDSLELRVYAADGRSSLRLVVNPEGTWAVQRRIAGKHVEGEGGVKAQASLTDTALDFEAHIPFAALGGDSGDRQWRILPVRNFRTGTNIHAPLPYAHRGGLGGHDRSPLFTLNDSLPFVQLDPLQQALYAGRPMVRTRLGNPTDAPADVAIAVRVLRGDDVLGTAERTLALPPNETLPVTLPVQCDPPIDPETEDEYRYVLDITGPGDVELLHTHFTWNPTENRAWLGDRLPGYQNSEERVVTIDPREPVPLPFQRFMKHYQDLPADHRLRIASRRRVVPGRGFVADSVQHITPVDPEGRKNGVQTFYRIGYILEHSITWRQDVRHGPEKFHSHARNERGRSFGYVQKVVPWVDGEINGVQSVYHPNGEPLAETRYVDGRPTGVSRRYDRDGRLTKMTPYENALPHGTAKEFYPRRPKRVIPMREGAIKGVILHYDWQGKLVDKLPYEAGMELDVPIYKPGDEADNPDLAREFDEKAQRATWTDAEGRVIQTVDYRDGVRDGNCTVYWPRRIKRTIPYEKGLITGTVVDYWENGNVQKERPFREDVPHGTEKHFAENGELLKTRHWIEGDIAPAGGE